MHLIDGPLVPYVWGSLAGIAAIGVVVAERSTRWSQDDRKIPMMGVMGAFIFAAQMVNIPIGPGVSGHLLGAALVAILVGPAPAVLVMSCIVIIQCLILQDGGAAALGANIVNLGIIAPLVGWGVHSVISRCGSGRRVRLVLAPLLAGWASVVVPGLAVAVELGLSGTIMLSDGMIFLGLVHAAIGLGEGAITVAVLRYLVSVRPDVVPGTPRPAPEASK